MALALLGRGLEHEPDRALSQLWWVPALERPGGVVWCHDSIFLQGMESPPKSVRFSQLSHQPAALEFGTMQGSEERIFRDALFDQFGEEVLRLGHLRFSGFLNRQSIP